jgi:inner membrane protein
MDGLTQAVLGGAAGQAALGHKLGNKAGLIGAVAGAAPDLDILLRSAEDPLMALTFHRHFTHSLLLIPAGGLLVGTLFWLLWRSKITFWQAALVATVGWATHGTLDLFTSYGTHLLWPFSDARLAWDWVGIVDLWVTIPLLVGLIVAWRLRRRLPAAVGLVVAMLYIGYGALQHIRADEVQQRIAAARGQTVQRGRVVPSPMTLSVWRSVYAHDGKLCSDAVRIAPFSEPLYWAGGCVEHLQLETLLGDLPQGSRLAEDLRRFDHFSDDWLVRLPGDGSMVVGDFRYAMVPDEVRPLWGIRFDPDKPHQHVTRVNFRDARRSRFVRFFGMLDGSLKNAQAIPPPP